MKLKSLKNPFQLLDTLRYGSRMIFQRIERWAFLKEDKRAQGSESGQAGSMSLQLRTPLKSSTFDLLMQAVLSNNLAARKQLIRLFTSNSLSRLDIRLLAGYLAKYANRNNPNALAILQKVMYSAPGQVRRIVSRAVYQHCQRLGSYAVYNQLDKHSHKATAEKQLQDAARTFTAA